MGDDISSDAIVCTLEERLGIRLGETTPDGRFTLDEVECLASCGTAPVALVGQETTAPRFVWDPGTIPEGASEWSLPRDRMIRRSRAPGRPVLWPKGSRRKIQNR